MKKNKIWFVTGSTLIMSVAVAGSAMAASHAGVMVRGRAKGQMMNPPAVMGTVSAINGSTINVTAKNGTAYTVDASGATVLKNGTSSQVSAITTGDVVVVLGNVSGTIVKATKIVDGINPM